MHIVEQYAVHSKQDSVMSSIIPLEGRTRLPSKIQDAIQDSGLIITQILNASRSNEWRDGGDGNGDFVIQQPPFPPFDTRVNGFNRCLSRQLEAPENFAFSDWYD
ncbi:hypothetical protein Tcan_05015 [Toxocara canis]|uniref:Uncharacterized protein n=1 Tax=Toxocara canis TaxID=6265 RepID=A0A0B2VL04_TOXCA|nr:hypothetical protein Tcan_05015 [Toxocara canis]